jgi:hypothetical protein
VPGQPTFGDEGQPQRVVVERAGALAVPPASLVLAARVLRPRRGPHRRARVGVGRAVSCAGRRVGALGARLHVLRVLRGRVAVLLLLLLWLVVVLVVVLLLRVVVLEWERAGVALGHRARILPAVAVGVRRVGRRVAGGMIGGPVAKLRLLH